VIIRRVFALTFWGIFGGLAIWPIYVTGHQIYKLSKTFPIIINARHPDRCGGLKPLGDFFFLMALPFVVLGIGLVLKSIGGLLNNMFLDSPLFSAIRTLSANLFCLLCFCP
jgi:hypothetical protein